eukprot:11478720-Alexandrium_andersonii.AAC.1
MRCTCNAAFPVFPTPARLVAPVFLIMVLTRSQTRAEVEQDITAVAAFSQCEASCSDDCSLEEPAKDSVF